MELNYKGKRLLILGANQESVPIVAKAKSLGMEVYVADNIIGAPAKLIADVGVDIDGKDVTSLASLVKKQGIDGVMLGVADTLIQPYYELCSMLNKPCYVNSVTKDVFSDKSKWTLECKKNGIPTLELLFEGGIKDNWYQKKYNIPVVVKPQRNRGGKGVVVCPANKDVVMYVERACAISDDGKCRIERFYECQEVTAYYCVEKGKADLLTVSDSFWLNSLKDKRSFFCGMIFPSGIMQAFKANVDDKLKRLFKTNGVNDGIISVQCFFFEGKFIPYDFEFNLTGSMVGILSTKCFKGYDAVSSLIDFSLTGDMNIKKQTQKVKKVSCAVIYIYLRPGKITRIDTSCLGRVDGEIEIIQKAQEGDIIGCEIEGTTKAIFARVWVTNENREQLLIEVRDIQNGIEVLDENNQSMVMR